MLFHLLFKVLAVLGINRTQVLLVDEHGLKIRVTRCGRLCLGRRKINLSNVFAGQMVGIREVADQVWLVSFMDYDLGFFDQEQGRVEPALNPFAPEKVLTMSPE